MDVFDFGFTLFMILFPAVFTLFFRPKQPLDDARRARVLVLGRRLWAGTGVALLACVALYVWQPAVAYFMWLAFFLLWFLLAMPLLQTRNPEWGPIRRGTVRSASLVPRDRLPPELVAGWISVTVLWLLLLCVALLGVTLFAQGPARWWLLLFNLAAGAELWILHWAMRRSMIEPEPVSPLDNDAIRVERENFHRFKLYGWLWLALAVMLIFSVPPLLLIWYGDGVLTWAIVVGAGGGTLVGIGGGVFGTIASLKRAKINRLALDAGAHD